MGIGGAVVEQKVERPVGVGIDIRGQAHGDRSQPVEYGRADAFPVAAHVDQAGARAVRAAVQVDRLVAERGAHIVEVVHGDRRCVVARVADGFHFRQAFAQVVERQRVDLQRLAELLLVHVALEEGAGHPARAAGTPLIDEDEVSVAAHVGEPRQHRSRQLGGGLARTAGEEEERIRLRVVGNGRDHDDLQVDGPSVTRSAVLVDGQRAATGRDGDVVQAAILEIDSRLRGRERHAYRGAQRQDAQQHTPESSRVLRARHGWGEYTHSARSRFDRVGLPTERRECKLRSPFRP